MNSTIKIILLLVFGLSVLKTGHAEIQFDGSIGRAGDATKLGNSHLITDTDGQIKGSNLFHSFNKFNLSVGESANFYNLSAVPLTNVISRVTGGLPSNIDGAINSYIPGANFWFINPNGVLFGPHASLNVQSSFYVSTANYLKFADGTLFQADQSAPPILTMAAPESFGFLEAKPASITFEGSGSKFAQDNFGLKMAVPEGKTFAVAGGDISLHDGKLLDIVPVEARIKAPGGRMAFVSVASKGEMNPNAQDINTTNFRKLADITMQSNLPQGGQINASGTGGGEIIIRGGNLTMNNSSLVSNTEGSVSGKKIDVDIRENMNISTNGAGIYSVTTNSGKGSDVVLNASKLLLAENGFITSGTGSTGNGGKIKIFADEITLNQSKISTVKGDGSTGSSGDIELNGNNIVMSNVSNIFTQIGEASSNKAGSISVNGKNVTIENFSGINSNTGQSGNAQGGDITLSVAEKLLIRDGNILYPSGVFSNALDGHAGKITIKAKAVELKNGGMISGDTIGKGKASDIAIIANTIELGDAKRTIDVNSITSKSTINSTGDAGNVMMTADTIRVGEGSGIIAVTGNNKKAGNITLISDKLILDAGFISTSTVSTGNAGNIEIHSKSINISNGSQVKSDNFLPPINGILYYATQGNAGNISIFTKKDIAITGNSKISTATASEGKAGDVTLRSEGSISVHDKSIISSSSLRPPPNLAALQTNEKGRAGNLLLIAKNVSLSRGGKIDAGTVDGQGGKIEIHSDEVNLKTGGIISTTTEGKGNAGNIRIDGLTRHFGNKVMIEGVDDNLIFELPNGKQVAGQPSGIYLNTSGAGNGGALTLNADKLIITDGGLISAISAFGSTEKTQGGNIIINVNSMKLSSGGLISPATSGLGKAGDVFINAKGAIEIDGQLDRIKHAQYTNRRVSYRSGINSSATFAIDDRTKKLGSGGSITVTAKTLNLTNGGEISVANEGTNADNVGGSIAIDAGDRFYSNNSRISAQTASARGGDINLKAKDMIHLVDSEISTSVASGKGSGGNILIDPTFVILDNSKITANALAGTGGNINIIADHFIQSPDSLVSASSQFGINGQVNISSPDTNMIGKVAALTAKFIDPSALFKAQCEARYIAGQSSMSVQLYDVHPAPGEGYFSALADAGQKTVAKSCAENSY